MLEHIKDLLKRSEYSEDTKDEAIRRILLYGEDSVTVMQQLGRVNLGFIASYLGMTQQYLSSLRAEVRFLRYMKINQRRLCYFCLLSIAYED